LTITVCNVIMIIKL